jgi:excisionase family DNA binding protein
VNVHDPAARSESNVTPNTALFRVTDVATRLGISTRSVWRLIAANKVDVVRIGRSVRIRPDAIEKLISKGGC